MTLPDDFFYPAFPSGELLKAIAALPEGAINVESWPKKLVIGKAVFNPTPGTREFCVVFEPTELLLSLVAAVGTVKFDNLITQITHNPAPL